MIATCRTGDRQTGPRAQHTFAPIEPVAAEYAPAGGDSAVVDCTGAPVRTRRRAR